MKSNFCIFRFSLALVTTGIAIGAAPDALTPVPIQNVTVDDAFWSPKLSVWRSTTINDVFDKFDQYGGFQNFDRVAAGQTGGHQGDPWCDGLIYETIRAAGDLLAAHPDPVLLARVRGYVVRISAAAAHDPDGYVNTAQQLNGIGYKWTNPPQPGDQHDDDFPHTIYNAGCLVEAGIHFYQATGDTELLRVATRLANYMCGIMGPSPKLNIIPGHALGEESMVRLYQLYRDEPALEAAVGLAVNETAYLNLAQFWIENRGNTAGRISKGAYNQDDVSVFLQPKMQGHAVRSALLATGMAAAAVENNRTDYRQTVERWWLNMVNARMYLTGGLGAVAAHEGFGADYELPNNGYAETCAAAAGGFFSHNMNLLTGEARYADILERELYNGALAGVSLQGDTYFYTNPLTAGPEHRRWEWAGFGLGLTPCCPPMFLKLAGALPGCIYATKDDAVFVNLFVGSHATIQRGPLDLEITQTTNYPWDGHIEMDVTPAAPATFTVKLRMPGWAKSSAIGINGQPAQGVTYAKGYASITRLWSPGDWVSLDLPMPVERMKADPLVKANVGRVALMRGPVVYCFEGLDNNDSTKALLLGQADSFSPSHRPDLLGGVMELEGRTTMVRDLGGSFRKDPVTARAIPFYANQNRAATVMDLWVADNSTAVRPVVDGTPSASYCNPTDTVLALNDGIVPRLSDDESVPRMTWWNHKGTPEWAQILYQSPRAVSGVSVYWWDERRVGRECRVPQSWAVQYLDNSGNWQPVQGASAYGTSMDSFNNVTFQSVMAKGIRVVAQLQAGWAGGILEMVVGPARPTPTASYTNGGDTVTAINDGAIPVASDDESISRHTFWNHKGTSEWVQLIFPNTRRLSSLEIYWWDESRLNRECRVPQSWSVTYLDGGIWKPVQGATAYGTQMDTFNSVKFNEIETTAIRVQVQIQSGWSAGVLEMRPYESSLPHAFVQWLTTNGISTSAGMTSDSNHDGVTLLEAYALGLDPNVNLASSMPVPQLSSGGMSLGFWGGREDVLYSAERSTDLKSWTPHGVAMSAPDGSGIRNVTMPAGGSAEFLRLRFTGEFP